MRGTDAFLGLNWVLGCERRLGRTMWAPIHDASTWLNRSARLGLWEVGLSLRGENDICLGGAPTLETGPNNKGHDEEEKDWRVGGAEPGSQRGASIRMGCVLLQHPTQIPTIAPVLICASQDS